MIESTATIYDRASIWTRPQAYDLRILKDDEDHWHCKYLEDDRNFPIDDNEFLDTALYIGTICRHIRMAIKASAISEDRARRVMQKARETLNQPLKLPTGRVIQLRRLLYHNVLLTITP